MHRTFKAAALATVMLGSAGMASAQVAAELQGDYAPGGDCTKQPRVSVAGASITIVAGRQSTRVAPIDTCQSCVAGERPDVIEVWAFQVGRDEAPIEPYFRINADEKRGALVVDKHGMQSFSPAVRAIAMASPLRRCPKR